MATTPEKDSLSGVETTGHVWDGIRELNNPLPRWWVWVLYATIIWSIGYWLLMPAWPTFWGYTSGFLGYSQRDRVAAAIEAAEEAKSGFRDRIRDATLEDIRAETELLEFALAGGQAAFGDNCAPCHGTGAQGSPGYPNLNDDDWIWGGTPDDILHTINYGIRAAHDDTRFNDMPAFGRDGILGRDEISDTTEYVLSLSQQDHDTAAAERGAVLFEENCVACHMEGGVGSTELGAPNLTDGIWLFGGERADIVRMIANSRSGVMPAWTDRLDAATIKELTVYVHSLGGGQ